MGSISSVSHNRDVFVDKLFSFCLNQIMEQQSVRCGRKLPIRRRVWTEKNGARINGHDQNNFMSLPSVLQLLYFWGFPYGNHLIKSQIQVGSRCNSIFLHMTITYVYKEYKFWCPQRTIQQPPFPTSVADMSRLSFFFFFSYVSTSIWLSIKRFPQGKPQK